MLPSARLQAANVQMHGLDLSKITRLNQRHDQTTVNAGHRLPCQHVQQALLQNAKLRCNGMH